jgi:hypothetical protein
MRRKRPNQARQRNVRPCGSASSIGPGPHFACATINPDVAEHWAEWRGLLPDHALAPVLRASDVVAAGPSDGHATWAGWMAERYRLT